MAQSPLRSKALHHGRSLSLPSGSNPAISLVDESLSRVTSSEATSSSLSSLNTRINGLTDLYNNIDDLLMTPHNQHIVSDKCVDRTLDDYIRLLDACSMVKDLVLVTKQDLRDLLSSVRRKDVDGIHGYLASRKKSKKMIQKSLKNLRTFKSNDLTSLEKESENKSLVYILKEAESVAFSVLGSLLAYSMGHARKSGWSMVSSLIQSKKVSNQVEETLSNEFDKVDSLLQSSQENEELMSHLKEMDTSMLVLEEELEFLFRKLIKTRVSLLNILNH